MTHEVCMSLTIIESDAEKITRAAEAMARIASGLALEEINVSFNITTVDDPIALD